MLLIITIHSIVIDPETTQRLAKREDYLRDRLKTKAEELAAGLLFMRNWLLHIVTKKRVDEL